MKQDLELLRILERDFGRKLRDIRLSVGLLSAEEVAKELDLGLSSLYKNERGENLPSKATLNTLCRYYGLDRLDKKQLFKEREEIIELRRKVDNG